MNEEKEKFRKSLSIVSSFLVLLWLIKIAEYLGQFSLTQYGLNPGSIKGLIGLITTPLIHGDFDHLASNSLPILFLGTGLFYFYLKSSKNVIVALWIIPGIFVWILGRPSYHIGASGIIYGLVTFLFFSGIIRKDKRSITLSLLVTFLYGGIIWGVFPTKEGVSWEYHLFGAFVGFVMAFVNRKKDPAPKYSWEEEDDEDDEKPEKLEVDWTKPPPW